MKQLVMPHNQEAEEQVLGSIMMNPGEYSYKIDMLSSEDFYMHKNKKIYLAMKSLYMNGKPISAITVNEEDREIELIDLVEMCDTVATSRLVDHYIQILKDHTSKRKIISASNKMIDDILNDNVEDIREYAYKASSFLEDSVSRTTNELRSITEIIDENIEETKQRAQGKKSDDLLTGYLNIDVLTRGIDKTSFVVIAARPSVGKTAFALNLAMKASRANNTNVAFFSLEMEASQIAYRIMSNISRVSSSDFKNGLIARNNVSKLEELSEISRMYKVFIDDSATVKIADIKDKCKKIKKEKGLGLIIIDYLQLMKSSRNSANRYEAASEISRDLKLLAKELKVPVVALSQLNRSVESKTDNTPKMSDLRDSGAIEQDADIIMLMSRNDYQKDYNKKTSRVKVNLAKVRNGSTGTAEFWYYRDNSLFTEIVEESKSSSK